MVETEFQLHTKLWAGDSTSSHNNKPAHLVGGSVQQHQRLDGEEDDVEQGWPVPHKRSEAEGQQVAREL